MGAKKDASRYTIKFDITIPSHKEAMRTLDETGRSKAALIADAIRIRNAFYSRNEDGLAALMPTVSPQPPPVQSQPKEMTKAPSLPSKSKTQDASGAVKSDGDFWEGMDDALNMFSV